MVYIYNGMGFPCGSVVKNLPVRQDHRRHRFNSWIRKIPWRRKWQPTPVFLPGKFHGQWDLVGYSPWGHRVGPNWCDLAHTMVYYLSIKKMKYYHCSNMDGPRDYRTKWSKSDIERPILYIYTYIYVYISYICGILNTNQLIYKTEID